MDDEGDRQTRAKRKRSRRADKVGGGGDTNAGGKDKEYVSQTYVRAVMNILDFRAEYVRADMNILRGSAQPKKSESLNQVFSQSLTENFFFLTDASQV